jgi:hypothetical protein
MARIPCRIVPHLADGEDRVWSPAGIASARRKRRAQNGVDFLTGNCGPSLSMFFERIGTVSMPVKTTANRIASGPLATRGSRIRVRIAKRFGRPVTPRSCRRGSVNARAGPGG